MSALTYFNIGLVYFHFCLLVLFKKSPLKVCPCPCSCPFKVYLCCCSLWWNFPPPPDSYLLLLRVAWLPLHSRRLPFSCLPSTCCFQLTTLGWSLGWLMAGSCSLVLIHFPHFQVSFPDFLPLFFLPFPSLTFTCFTSISFDCLDSSPFSPSPRNLHVCALCCSPLPFFSGFLVPHQLQNSHFYLSLFLPPTGSLPPFLLHS